MAPKTKNVPAVPDYGGYISAPSEKIRKEAFDHYCIHIASGLPRQSYHYHNPPYSISWKTVEKYTTQYPDECPIETLDRAMAAQFKLWFERGVALIDGRIKGNANVWFSVMKNLFKIYGWDEDAFVETNKSHILLLAEGIRARAVSKARDVDSSSKKSD